MKKISYNAFLRGAFRENAKVHSIPSFGSFELTPLCNLDCKMCYVHLSDPDVRARIMDGPRWISLMEQAVGRGMTTALLTGGEAMTHPDFWQIYMFLIDNGVSVRLKTNGILLNPENIRRLADYPPYTVEISLYGCDSESYMAVTGHDVFQAVSDNIRAAVDAGLHLCLMITPSAYMLPWVDGVMDYAKALGLPVKVNDLFIEPAPETGRSGAPIRFSMEDNQRIYLRGRELFPAAPRFEENEAEMYGALETPSAFSSIGLSCNGGRTGFAITWEGMMRPCLPFPKELIHADPFEGGFDAAWGKINQAVRNFQVPEKCAVCAYHNRCFYCPVMHGRYAPACDPEVCAWRMWQVDRLASCQ